MLIQVTAIDVQGAPTVASGGGLAKVESLYALSGLSLTVCLKRAKLSTRRGTPMWSKIVLATAILAVGLAAAGLTAISQDAPTVEELTADIRMADEQLSRADEFGSQYAAGSLIRVQSDLEASILRSTRAMLEQKLSWLRGISLSYVIDGIEPKRADGSLLAELDQEILEARQQIHTAELNAAQYSGGLIQAMALMQLQTQRVTLATLQQHRALARLGFAVPKSAEHSTPELKESSPVGRSIDDKGAL
jgi:hypothetical protein